LFDVLLVMAPPSQELEPPTNPGRFNQSGTPVQPGSVPLDDFLGLGMALLVSPCFGAPLPDAVSAFPLNQFFLGSWAVHDFLDFLLTR
jgi:hypothetical protein